MNFLFNTFLLYLYGMISFSLTSYSSLHIFPDKLLFEGKKYLQEFKTACTEDNGKLWKKSLCVPMIILDKKNMYAVASHPDPYGDFKEIDGVWVGKYNGPKTYANTSIKWKEQTWSMVLTPLPINMNDRRGLLIHEAWHSVQDDLGLPAKSVDLAHLDQYDGRLLIRLEWNALLKALNSKKNRRKHIEKALAIRMSRYKKYNEAKNLEQMLDLNEGLAEYTGTTLSGRLPNDINSYLSKKLNNIPKITSLTRSASYYSGPLYGILLDESGMQWKIEIKKIKDLGELLRKAYNIESKELERTLSVQEIEDYGYSEILSFEKKRKSDKEQKIKDYISKTTTPKSLYIVPSSSMQFTFDPYEIIHVEQDDFIYIHYTVNDLWGTLKVSDGVRIKNIKGEKTLILSPPTEIKAKLLKGHGWQIQLKAGWKIKKNKSEKYFLIYNG